MEAARMRQEQRQAICNYACEVLRQDQMRTRNLAVLCRYADECGMDTLLHWIDIAGANIKWINELSLLKYVSGIRRNVNNKHNEPS